MAGVGADAECSLEFDEGGLGERAKVIGRAMPGERLRGGTFVFLNEIFLKRLYVLAPVPHREVSRECISGRRGGRCAGNINPFRGSFLEKRLELRFELSKEGLKLRSSHEAKGACGDSA